VDRDVPRITREYERFGFVRDMKARLATLLQDCIEAKIFPATVDPAVGVRVLTMGILGVSVMRLSDRLGPTENADDLARDVLDVLIAGLQSGLTLRTHGLLVCPEDEQQPTSDSSSSDLRSVR